MATKKKVKKKSEMIVDEISLYERVNLNADMKRLEHAQSVKERNERAFTTIALGCIILGFIVLVWGVTRCTL